MGTPAYATSILDKLIKNNHEIVAIFTQPDKKIGRKQIFTPSHIKKYCVDNKLNIPIYQPESIKSSNHQTTIQTLKPDFIIVAAFGQLLPENILNIAPCINLHASLLPKYRGASPIQKSILNNDQYSGVTSIIMEKSLDSGDILGYSYYKMSKEINSEQLFKKLSLLASQLTIDTINNFHRINRKKQNKTNISYCHKIIKNDGLINFNNAHEVYQKYKAYINWPGIYIQSGLKLKEITLNECKSSNKSGEIIKINKNYVLVGCDLGSLKIFSVQPNSKKTMNIIDYLRGSRLEIGNYLS